jgi:hypothetical protein
MGADIYLRSVMTEEFETAIVDRELRDLTPGTSFDTANAMYAALAETGGYFRDPYNRFNLLNALGMDWGEVQPLLSPDRKLPIEGARRLLAELERRWVMQGAVDNAMLGPANTPLGKMLEEVAAVLPEGSVWPRQAKPGEDWSEVLPWLSKKRSQLIALLRRSIELNEPLECSL